MSAGRAQTELGWRLMSSFVKFRDTEVNLEAASPGGSI
jgi:hypothetical protein